MMGWLRRNWLVVTSLLLLSAFFIPPAVITLVNNENDLDIYNFARADLNKTVMMQNFTVIEVEFLRIGYDEIRANSMQEFLAGCRLWGVKEVYDLGGEYIAYNDSLMRDMVFLGYPAMVKTSDGRDCMTVVKGFPYNEYTWENPLSGKKTTIGWVIIRH